MGKTGVKTKKKSATKQVIFSFARQEVINNRVLDYLEINEHDKLDIDDRLKLIENTLNNPVVKVDTSAVSQEMLANLKKTTPPPVMISTPPAPKVHCYNHQVYPHGCSNCKNGTEANYGPPPEPKVSQWRDVEERTKHTLTAVTEALKLMRGINYLVSPTAFTIEIRREGYVRKVNVQFYTNNIIMHFYRRSGRLDKQEFINTTKAAAGIVAVVMWYATR